MIPDAFHTDLPEAGSQAMPRSIGEPGNQAPLLDVDAVGKAYASFESNVHRFARWFGMRPDDGSRNWALRDISFTLRPGESIAIIGQNGAGKSTLLKLITGTIRPTIGTISHRGRISAMLELGLGFNPEFTGRQNVYLAGGLMGFSTRELNEQIAGIESFAELGSFFDEPLRVYSSGMQARLAFAVATATRPDVLLVDEVLSVGDSYFQHKSFDRIREYRAAGTSLIFVSHSMSDVRSLCDRVILIQAGAILRDGPADEVVDYYNAMIAARENANLSVEQRRLKEGWVYTRSGSHEAVMRSLTLVDASSGEPLALVNVGQEVALVAEIDVHASIERLVLGFLIRDKFGNTIWGTNTFHTDQPIRNLEKGCSIRVRLAFEARLGPGSYAVSHALHADESHVGTNYEWVDNALVFDVANLNHPHFIGTNWLPMTFAVETKPYRKVGT